MQINGAPTIAKVGGYALTWDLNLVTVRTVIGAFGEAITWDHDYAPKVALAPIELELTASQVIPGTDSIVELIPVELALSVGVVEPEAPAFVELEPVELALELGVTTPERAPEPPTHLIWTHDYAGAQTMALHALHALETDDRLGDSETLRFTIAADDPKAVFVLGDTLVRYRRRYYRVTTDTPTRDGTRTTIDVEAEALWVDLANELHVGDFTLIEKTATEGAAAILSSSDWAVDEDASEATLAIYGIDKADASSLELLRDWAKITNLELDFDTEARTVALVAQVGGTQDLGFRYGLNLKGIKRRWTPPAATKLYAYGRNHLSIAALAGGDEFVEDFSFYIAQGLTEEEARASYTKAQVWSDDSFVSDAPLYAAAVARLARLAQPIISYESTVADLAAATDSPVGRYTLGDSVPVVDGPLNISVRARVVRLVRRPLNPSATLIELAYLEGPPLDSSETTRVPNQAAEWLLFGNDSDDARTAFAGIIIPTDVGLQFATGGDALVNAEVLGVATGSGTLQLKVYDETADVPLSEVLELPFTNGQVIHETFAFGLQGLAGDVLFSLRAQVISGTGTVSIPAGDARLWVLAKGGLGVSIQPEPNFIQFDYVDNSSGWGGSGLTVQTWEVPPDVTTVVIDCYGAEGGDQGNTTTQQPGQGGRIRARFPVTAGETLNIRVGAKTDSHHGGLNGGGNGGNFTAGGSGGGGAADVRRPSNDTLAGRLIVGAGGGGCGNYSPGGPGGSGHGGGGGGLVGLDGRGNSTLFGHGGTQSAGGAGAGTSGTSSDGQPGTLGQGGSTGNGFALGSGGGGGGGGLYGGGAGASNSGGDNAGGGGGSSGVNGAASEVLTEQGVRSGHGVIIISWDTP